jgi:casein kinase 1 delta/casein kinase I family protein HRR25
MVNFLIGTLPWAGMKKKRKQDKHSAIRTMKREYGIEKLTKDLPKEIAMFGNYIRSVKFEQ